ncbi:MAG: lipopolysaccharide biosynthesis protein [Chloroflexia bacterium]
MPEALRTRVSKAMFWNTALFPLKTAVSFLASLIVVNGLRVTGFGTYSSLLAAATLIGQYTDLGLERSLPKFLPEVELRFGRDGVRLFLQWLLGFKLILLTLVITAVQAGSATLTSFLGLSEGGPLLIGILCALIVLGSLSNIMVQILFAFFKQKAYNLLDLLTGLMQPALTALLVLLGFGVLGAVVSLLVTTVVILALQSWQAVRAGREISLGPSQVGRRELLSLLPRFWPYSLLIYLINISSTIYEPEVALMVLTAAGDMSGRAVLALGARYVREFNRFLVAPQTGVQVPLFSRLFVQGDRPGLQKAYGSLTRLFILTLLPTGVGLALLSRGLIQLLYRQEFGGAVGVVLVLIVGDFLDSMLGSVPHNILMAHERYRPVIVARVLILGTASLIFWLAPRYGALGAALAMTTARLVGIAVVLGYVLHAFHLDFPWAFLGRVVGATLAYCAIILPILGFGRWGIFDDSPPASLMERITGLLILAGVAGLGAAVFFLAFKRLGGLEQEDRARVAELNFPLKKWVLRWL